MRRPLRLVCASMHPCFLLLLLFVSALTLHSEMAVAQGSPPSGALISGTPCNGAGPEPTLIDPDSGTDGDDVSSVAEITEQQPFFISFSCSVDARSFAGKLWLESPMLGNRIPLRWVDGREREQYLCTNGSCKDRSFEVFIADQSLPPGTPVRLVVDAGIRGGDGSLSTTSAVRLYNVRPRFEALLRCERTMANGACDPFLPIYLAFTNKPLAGLESRYDREQVAQLLDSNGQPSPHEQGWYLEGNRSLPAIKFIAPFPPRSKLSLVVQEGIVDQSSRALSNESSFPLQVAVGPVPPMVRFSSVFGVLEAGADGALLPVTLRNVERELPAGFAGAAARVTDPSQIAAVINSVTGRYRDIEKNNLSLLGDEGNLDLRKAFEPSQKFSVKKQHAEEAFEVVGIPLQRPGFYLVEVGSSRLDTELRGERAEKAPVYFPTTALVTRMSVHFKWGRESSLGWVTDLASSAPVSEAEFTLYDCAGGVRGSGRTASDGTVSFGKLPLESELPACTFTQQWSSSPGVTAAPLGERLLFAVAAKADDLSFVFSSWDNGIEPWRFQVPFDSGWRPSTIRAHTFLDRTLLRRGETVHMRHFLRHAVSGSPSEPASSFAALSNELLPVKAQLRHFESGEVVELPIQSELKSGATVLISEWSIPAGAKLGEYSVSLMLPGGTEISSGDLSVLDYRVPLMKGEISLAPEASLTPPTLPLDLSVRYLAGGSAAELPVTVRYQIQPGYFQGGAGFERFRFGQESVSSDEEFTPQRSGEIRTVSAQLDAQGTARVTLNDLPAITEPRGLLVELEFRDPNGAIQSVARTVTLTPASVVMGIRTDGWVSVPGTFPVEVASVTPAGQPRAFTPFVVRLYTREIYTHRKKVVGGMFAYENAAQLNDQGIVCRGVTDALGRGRCDLTPQLSGNLYLEVAADDPALDSGGVSRASTSVWLGSDRELWFSQSESDRVDLIPERERYEPGEVARLQLRTPFREATALVTVEREGVLEHFVTTVRRSNPVIEIPVRGGYAPNVVVSVVLVRGRISEAQPTAVFDPGKPAFRIGMTNLQVGWREYSLGVTVTPEKSRYEVKDNVTARVLVTPPTGRTLPVGTTVAVAVVDAGLLELKPNNSVRLLERMMEERASTVRTMTASMFLIGKRHFGLKALPFGGGGGKGLTRELFDTLVYWNPAVPVGADGVANLSFTLNDSVTAFKILSVASSGDHLFGYGSGTIQSDRAFALFSGIPPVLRSGDEVVLGMTVKNGGAAAADLELSLAATDSSGAAVGEAPPVERTTVAAEHSSRVQWRWKVPAVAGEGADAQLSFTAEARVAGVVRDRVVVKQKLLPALPQRILGAALEQLMPGEPKRISAAAVSGVVPGSLTVSGVASSSISQAIDGVRQYMEQYPYGCLEQQASRAVAMGDTAAWDGIMQKLPQYLDSRGLARYFPTEGRGDEVLTSYLLSVADAAGWQIPDRVRKQMLDALRAIAEGRSETRASPWITTPAERVMELRSRRLRALAALARHGERSAKGVALVGSELSTLSSRELVELWRIMLGESSVDTQAAMLRSIVTELRKRTTTVGGTITLDSKSTVDRWWFMESPEQAQILLLELLVRNPEVAAQVKLEPGRLLAPLFGTMQNGHWWLTTSNALAVAAVSRFQQEVEGAFTGGVQVSGRVTVESANSGGAAIAASIPLSPDQEQGSFSAPVAELTTPLEVTYTGTTGAPWMTMQWQGARALSAPVSEGFTLSREVTPVVQRTPGALSVGDIVEVTLRFNATADLGWVALTDPIPSGALILGNALGGESQLFGTSSALNKEEAWPTFIERQSSHYRAYFAELGAGSHVIRYRMQLQNAGVFAAGDTRVEAMYQPLRFGELPVSTVTIVEPAAAAAGSAAGAAG